jgi:hypothetical protein
MVVEQPKENPAFGTQAAQYISFERVKGQKSHDEARTFQGILHMRIEQNKWTEANGWTPRTPGQLGEATDLVLLFGSTAVFKKRSSITALQQAYPKALILGCSTAGEICGTQVTDEALVATAIDFEATQIKGACVKITDVENSYQAGKRLAESLDKNGLVHVFVLSDGLTVNGSELVSGLTGHLPHDVIVTGGLSGDGARFQETLVMCGGAPEAGTVAALGLYGDRLKIGYGSLGGWDSFGPERLVTKSLANVLYELDGKPALDLYKQYLGDHAKGLPATGLLFPLSLRANDGGPGVVRTILSVNEEGHSMTFAGDIPTGGYVRLMKANFERLIDGAAGAAKACQKGVGSSSPDLAVLISCVGRKLVLKQRIEEEVEGVRDVLGEHAVLTGFYSYGEISPFIRSAKCELHNQTMTITTFSEN